MKKISVIIPAYNEEKSIENTLKEVKKLLGNLIYEIIVVNDCSSDKTLEILKKISEIKIINNKKNLGKGASVAKAIEKSNGDYIFLLDADLLNLKAKDLEEMIKPINNNEVEVTISFLKNSWPLFPFKKIDYCSGQRIISKKILNPNLEKIKQSPSYSLEGIINDLIIENKLKIKVIYWREVENRYHTDNLGFIKGRLRNFKIWREIMRGAGGFFRMYKVNIELSKLSKKPTSRKNNL